MKYIILTALLLLTALSATSMAIECSCNDLTQQFPEPDVLEDGIFRTSVPGWDKFPNSASAFSEVDVLENGIFLTAVPGWDKFPV